MRTVASILFVIAIALFLTLNELTIKEAKSNVDEVSIFQELGEAAKEIQEELDGGELDKFTKDLKEEFNKGFAGAGATEAESETEFAEEETFESDMETDDPYDYGEYDEDDYKLE